MTTRLTQSDKDMWISTKYNYLSRWHGLLPCPLELTDANIKELYTRQIPKEHLEAFEMLQNAGYYNAGDTTRKIQLSVADERENIIYMATFTLESEIAVPYHRYRWTRKEYISLDKYDKEYLALLAWAKKVVTVGNEIGGLRQDVDNIVRACNTLGQVHTHFPELVAFMPLRMREEISKIKRRSPAVGRTAMSIDSSNLATRLTQLALIDRGINVNKFSVDTL
ncbi:MAG: hypothetical protein DRR06_16980 [Gammaproteobacteria bacterium]|nr:MAG: hypothetical protein DRR06_16980 [Gammaproteobacteria bacterium]